MTLTRQNIRNGTGAFTLIEIMIAVGLFLIIIAGTLSIYLMCQKSWYKTSLFMEATQESSMWLARMVYGLGTNGGLREASSVYLNTNVHGHWSGTNYPPDAGAANHHLDYTTPADGSWALYVTNYAGIASGYEYNKNASNICFRPPNTLISNRLSVANYVTAASAIPTNKGINLSITVTRSYGITTNITAINSTFIKMRN